MLNVPIDDLKSVDQFILLDAVASSAPIGESGEIEPFQTLLVAELLERVRHFCGATLDTLGVCIKPRMLLALEAIVFACSCHLPSDVIVMPRSRFLTVLAKVNVVDVAETSMK